MQAPDGSAASVAEPAGAAEPQADSTAASPWWGRPWMPALVVAGLTAIGFAVRLAVANQAMLADELSTYWIISTNDLSGVVSTVHTDAEITPPLFFILSWLTTQIDLTPEMARLPSLIAGVATIPVIYLLGRRTIGRPGALVAAALTALSPFMIYYSAEARGYALLMFLVALSTLTMLKAAETRRVVWWIAYGAASCAAVYTHYTCVFALGAQFLWLVWAHPEARKAGFITNVVAAVAFLPWLSGVRADFDSPTTKIFSALNPFTWDNVGLSLSHASIGYPYSILDLGELPGTVAVVMILLAVVVAIVGLAGTRLPPPREWLTRRHRNLVLVVGLAFSVPVGEALVSAVGTDLFGGRNLASGWPAYALCLSALLVAAGPRLRYVSVGLAIGCFVIAAAKMLDAPNERPNYQAVADFIDEKGGPRAIVMDASVISPGPLSPLELTLGRHEGILRFGAPYQREKPFGVFDKVEPERHVFKRAVAAADGGPIFVVLDLTRPGKPHTRLFPARYRLAEKHTYRGIADLTVQMWTVGGTRHPTG